jgi:hypothetical protein
LLAVSGASGPSVVRIRREGMRGPEVASLLFRVWSEVAAFDSTPPKRIRLHMVRDEVLGTG